MRPAASLSGDGAVVAESGAAAKDGTAPAAVSSPVAAIVERAADPGVPLLERVAVLGQLPVELSIEELDRLHTLVNDRGAPPTVRNDALGAIVRAGRPLPGILPRLAATWRDGTEDKDWRAYCLQYLEIAHALDPDGRAEAEATLVVAAKDADPHFSGTALLSLARLGESSPEMKSAARAGAESVLERSARAPDGDGELPVATALQVARSTGSPLALPGARRLAADKDAAAMARLSALNVLGEAGTESDAAILAAVREDAAADPQLRRVAAHALDRLGKRLGIRIRS